MYSSLAMLYAGDRMQPDTDQIPHTRRRLKVREAAEELGITVEAVRARIKRGTLDHHKAPDGTVFVWLDGDRTGPDSDRPNNRMADRTMLVEVLRDEIAHLRRESERKDEIIMSLSLSNAEMSRTIRAIEAPTSSEAMSEPRESPVSAGEGEEKGAGPVDSQIGPLRRSWWRRIFGG